MAAIGQINFSCRTHYGVASSPGLILAPQRITELPSNHLISIVDDDQSARAAMGGLIRSLGYEAVAFVSAEDFLKSDGCPTPFA
jgi:hypothetical protein